MVERHGAPLAEINETESGSNRHGPAMAPSVSRLRRANDNRRCAERLPLARVSGVVGDFGVRDRERQNHDAAVASGGVIGVSNKRSAGIERRRIKRASARERAGAASIIAENKHFSRCRDA